MAYRSLSIEERIVIEEVDALMYALAKCGIKVVDMNKFVAEGLDKELVEWYYSGNWIKYENMEGGL